MSLLTTALLSFVIVAGITMIAGITLMRFWPVLQRERFGAVAATPSGAGSILRWSDAPRAGWERTIEQIGRAVGGSEERAPTKYRQRLMWAGFYEPRAVLLLLGAKVALGLGLGSLYFLYSMMALRAVPLPRDASDDLGASLGIPALTAHRCLLADGPIDGATVLVAGGAGAVGHAAIELARWAGARVVATVSGEEKGRLAREAGAHEVVSYRADDAAARILAFAPEGVDRIAEVAPAANAELDAAVAAPDAVVSFYANEGGGELTVPIRRFMTANLTLRGVLVYTMPAAALRQAVADVSAAVAAGALTTLPLHRFPLERIADAHDAVEQGAVGKVVVDVP